jgi:hypothetical protein
MIKVNKKNSARKFEEINVFANLEDAIDHCGELIEKEFGISGYKSK